MMIMVTKTAVIIDKYNINKHAICYKSTESYSNSMYHYLHDVLIVIIVSIIIVVVELLQ